MSFIEKRYLGDGVYAEVEAGMIKLTAENGAYVTNTIYLEAEVMRALDDYFTDALEAAATARRARERTDA